MSNKLLPALAEGFFGAGTHPLADERTLGEACSKSVQSSMKSRPNQQCQQPCCLRVTGHVCSITVSNLRKASIRLGLLQWTDFVRWHPLSFELTSSIAVSTESLFDALQHINYLHCHVSADKAARGSINSLLT